MRVFLGEFVGTFVLVFLGCISVAGAVLLHWLDALWQVALVWSAAVFLGILASRKWSHSHLNPAVTLSMVSLGHYPKTKEVFLYLSGQFTGAFLAAGAMFMVVGWLGGYAQGFDITSAMTFGEFYPNPSLPEALDISMTQAALAEALGTAFLLWMILETDRWKVGQKWLKPAIIGLTVGAIIMVVADYTQAGLNPARDFGPRLFSYLAGWKEHAFSQGIGTVWVYILAPIVGGVLASLLHQKVVFKAT